MKKLKKIRTELLLTRNLRTKAKKIGRKLTGKYEVTAGVVAAIEAYDLEGDKNET